MGSSTDGQICYGKHVGDQVPWYKEEYDYDILNWWLDTLFVPSCESPWNDEGGWIEDLSDSERARVYQAWRAEKEAWLREHPLNVEVINVCSDECPDYIIAVPGSVMTANRGEPVKLDPEILFTRPPDEAILKMRVFCINLQLEGPEGWFLSSYWLLGVTMRTYDGENAFCHECGKCVKCLVVRLGQKWICRDCVKEAFYRLFPEIKKEEFSDCDDCFFVGCNAGYPVCDFPETSVFSSEVESAIEENQLPEDCPIKHGLLIEVKK